MTLSTSSISRLNFNRPPGFCPFFFFIMVKSKSPKLRYFPIVMIVFRRFGETSFVLFANSARMIAYSERIDEVKCYGHRCSLQKKLQLSKCSKLDRLLWCLKDIILK